MDLNNLSITSGTWQIWENSEEKSIDLSIENIYSGKLSFTSAYEAAEDSAKAELEATMESYRNLD